MWHNQRILLSFMPVATSPFIWRSVWLSKCSWSDKESSYPLPVTSRLFSIDFFVRNDNFASVCCCFQQIGVEDAGTGSRTWRFAEVDDTVNLHRMATLRPSIHDWNLWPMLTLACSLWPRWTQLTTSYKSTPSPLNWLWHADPLQYFCSCSI